MIEGGVGGAQTLTGLNFEGEVDLVTLLTQIDGYKVVPDEKKVGAKVYFNDELVAR